MISQLTTSVVVDQCAHINLHYTVALDSRILIDNSYNQCV